MASGHILALFVLTITATTVMCQTFQYSRGWTNGKRSTSSMEELVNSVKNAGQLDSVLINCELQKLRLLLQGNLNSQLLQLPCELLTSSKRSFSENMINEHFHRQPTPPNNNY